MIQRRNNLNIIDQIEIFTMGNKKKTLNKERRQKKNN